MRVMETSESLMPELMTQWLTPLEEELGWADHRRAWHLLMTTLHSLRDLLPPDNAVNLGAELPFLMRIAYFQGWNPAQTPVRVRGKQEFVGRISAAFMDRPLDDPEEKVRTVLHLLRRQLPREEFEFLSDAMRNPKVDQMDDVDGRR